MSGQKSPCGLSQASSSRRIWHSYPPQPFACAADQALLLAHRDRTARTGSGYAANLLNRRCQP